MGTRVTVSSDPDLLYFANLSKRLTQQPCAHVNYLSITQSRQLARTARQPHAALDQRFGTPEGSHGRFCEHSSESSGSIKKNGEFLDYPAIISIAERAVLHSHLSNVAAPQA